MAEQFIEELNDFNREMNEGLDITLSFEVTHDGNRFDESDFKRINGWGSAIAGVVSVIAFSNAWNPVGWIAAGMGIVLSIFSYFSDSRANKLKEAKIKQRHSILDDIEKSKIKILSKLIEWFDGKVHRAIILPTENNLSLLCQSLNSLMNELGATDTHLYELKHEINARLMNRISHVITKQYFTLPKFIKIVRLPGYACYFLISDYFRNTELLKCMSIAMRERIIAVYDTSLDKQIAHLYKGLVERIEVVEQNRVFIYAQEQYISKIIGKDHRRIKMVAALCSCQITPISI